MAARAGAGAGGPPAVGVLCLQGSFALHLAALAKLGVPRREVRRPSDLDGLAGLILPGGESTVISQLLIASGLAEPLRERLAGGSLAALGTCAGAILLGREPAGERVAGAARAHIPREPVRLAVAATEVSRNAYGRQVDSFRAPLEVEGALAGMASAADGAGSGAVAPAAAPGAPLEGVFIRAPRFTRVPAEAEVLARHAGEPVLVREGRLLLGAFHPELTDDLRVHRLFCALAAGSALSAPAPAPAPAPASA